MSVSNSNYLLETFPQYVQDQMDRTAEEAHNCDKSLRVIKIFEGLRELKVLSQGLSQKLKTQEGILLFPKILCEKFIIEFKDIKSCHLRKNEQLYFLAWAFTNLEQIELYMLQTYFRIMCIIANFECKKYYDTLTIDYKSKYESDLSKIFLLIRTQREEFKIEVDSFFQRVLEYSGTKNNQFISFMMKFCKEKNMKCCHSYLTDQKSANKISEEKRRGFKQFKEEQVAKKESLKDSQQASQQISQSQQQPTQMRKPSQLLLKKIDQPQPLLQLQESIREIPRLSFVSRPSLTMRTIKEGINHRYKREKDHGQERRVQSEMNQQRQFNAEVCRKLEDARRRVVTCWNSDCLAPETPEVFSD